MKKKINLPPDAPIKPGSIINHRRRMIDEEAERMNRIKRAKKARERALSYRKIDDK